MADVEAFARLLVHRMANHRTTLVFSTQSAHKLKSKRRTLDKLAAGGLEPRPIYHPLHLDADFFRELVAELETEHYVKRRSNAVVGQPRIDQKPESRRLHPLPKVPVTMETTGATGDNQRHRSFSSLFVTDRMPTRGAASDAGHAGSCHTA